MRKSFISALILVAVAAVAQNPPANQQPAPPSFQTNLTETAQAPSYSDLYCSGFITNEKPILTNKVAAGVNSPDTTNYATGDYVYLSGSGFAEGARYSIVRELRDPNHYEPFRGQRAAIDALGQPFANIGRVRVVALRSGMAVAQVEFACQNVTLGDIAVPFVEHEPVSYRKTVSVQRFPGSAGRLTARIVLTREFDTLVGTGHKVYIDAGSTKGVKPGDYFRAVRGHAPAKIDPVDALSMNAPVGDDTQKNPGSNDRKTAAQLPVRTLGHLIVLTVTPTSSTAMITDALEGIQVGDQVELEGEE